MKPKGDEDGDPTETVAVDPSVNEPANDLNSTFELLLGRVPSDEEKQILYRIKTALRLRDTDSMWAILMALGNFQFLYRQHPKEIVTAGRANAAELRAAGQTISAEMLAAAAAIVKDLKTATAAETAKLQALGKQLEAQAKSSHEDNQRSLTAAVRDGAIAAAKDAAGAVRWQWAAACIGIACASLLAVGWWAKRTARDEGHATGWAKATSNCQAWQKADAWLKTNEGQLAYSLANAAPGTIAMLATCSSPGWKIVEGSCCPLVPNKGAKCWRLPAAK
jgi:hypothetical protein